MFSNTTVLVVHFPQQMSTARTVAHEREVSSFMDSGQTLLSDACFWEERVLPISLMSLEGPVVGEIEI